MSSDTGKVMEEEKTMKEGQLILTEEQVHGIIKLIDSEIKLNKADGNDAYNIYWENIKMVLGYAVWR